MLLEIWYDKAAVFVISSTGIVRYDPLYDISFVKSPTSSAEAVYPKPIVVIANAAAAVDLRNIRLMFPPRFYLFNVTNGSSLERSFTLVSIKALEPGFFIAPVQEVPKF